MFRFYTLLTILFAFLLFSGGCDKLIYDQYPDGEGGSGGNAPKVFLSVSHGGAAKLRSSSELPDGTPSINTDTEDYEDWVHDLALLVFDTSTGDLVTTHFETSAGGSTLQERFTIELTPGQRDFYFVANMPKPALEAISNRSGMETYLDGLYDLSANLYKAASSSVGFPMSRVYKNQTITKGGTVYMPAPFKPDGQDKVLLIRVVAKLEVKVHEDEADAVQSITLKNAFKEFHLQHGTVDGGVVINGIKLDNIVHYEDDIILTKNETKKSFFAYMPEALMTGAAWGTGDHKPINYFVIKTTSNKTFEVPIITSDDNYTFEQDYLKFAKGELPDKPDYNIFRNRKYHYQVKNLSDIEVAYKVNEWQYVPTSLYMGYGYNVEVDPDGNIKITNTIDDCMPHKVELKALNGAYFGDDNTKTEVVYGYSSKTDDGFTEAQMKTGYSESFKINNDAVTAGNPYMEVWYNGTKVKTFSK